MEDTQEDIIARKHRFSNKKTIDSLLLDLTSEYCIDKCVIISTLTDFLDASSVAIEEKQRIVDSVMVLYNLENKYELQESIFYCLNSASSNRVRQEQIVDIMLDYLLITDADTFVSYAIDILMDADLHSLEKEKLIKECLNSSNPHIRREILLYAEVNLREKPIQQ